MKDETLMRRYRGGDMGAFQRLFDRYKDRLYRYLLRMCADRTTAEEACQEVWERIIRTKERFDGQRCFQGYLFTIAHNVVVDNFRRQGRERDLLAAGDESAMEASGDSHGPWDDGGPTARRVYSREQMDRLAQLLNGLPPAQREIFLLRNETTMSMPEIAAMLGIEPEAAKSRLRYALGKLRKGMEGYL